MAKKDSFWSDAEGREEFCSDDKCVGYAIEVSPSECKGLQRVEISKSGNGEGMWIDVDSIGLHRYLCRHALPKVTMLQARSPLGPIWYQVHREDGPIIARVRVFRVDYDRPWEMEIMQGAGHELAACLIPAGDKLSELLTMEAKNAAR